ncbi:GNAT family N-acetyltransferase [Mycobacterium sp. D16Q16]|uniref:GNAT family N-acetyltransferase n=1 Tax=Mycobacterium sp. D16Q16 TaxID=1855659 RepID=UPI000993A8B8|nr:GNAT family N-acetyltransferase [Mycobacterium sp. D16Q16]
MNVTVADTEQKIGKSFDGAAITVRKLNRDDIRSVTFLHSGLNDRDRYLRFFTTRPKDVAAISESLTQQSRQQLSIGAFEHGRLVGVAHYVVNRDGRTAEVAILVARDDHQRGVGTMLLKCLTESAIRNGIKRFTADVLAENHTLVVMLRELELPHKIDHTDREVLHLVVELSPLENMLKPTCAEVQPG